MNVHPTDLETLEILARCGRLSAGELARESGRSTAGVTAVIDRLEARGFARRIRDPLDRRKVYVEIDREVADEIIVPLYGGMSTSVVDLADRYGDADIALIRDFLLATHALLREETERLREHKAALLPDDGTLRSKR
jgi:DNA-binding Lrp family transcriptional regulator